LPSIPHAYLDVILETLFRAWEQLCREHKDQLLAKNEIEISSLLHLRVNNLRQANDLFSQLVASAVRGAEGVSFDGSHIEKRPDLTLYLTSRNPNFPLVVECKIIDRRARKGVNLYCEEGLRRFIDGEYAWTNSEAVMLAYVRDQSSIEDTLLPHLTSSAAKPWDPLRTELMPKRQAGVQSPASMSRHGRSFRYIGVHESDEPGPIAIWHLWMQAPAAGVSVPLAIP
jgi:hypothetical protein